MNDSQIEERKNDDEKWSANFGCNPDKGSIGFGHVHIPRVTIWDRIFGNCEKGIHRFQQFEAKEFVPPGLQMESGYAAMVEALKTRVYEIRCTRCGRKPE